MPAGGVFFPEPWNRSARTGLYCTAKNRVGSLGVGKAVSAHRVQVVLDKPVLALLKLERLQGGGKPAIVLLDIA